MLVHVINIDFSTLYILFPIYSKHMYEVYCARFGLSDDTTAAIFIGMYMYKSHNYSKLV